MASPHAWPDMVRGWEAELAVEFAPHQLAGRGLRCFNYPTTTIDPAGEARGRLEQPFAREQQACYIGVPIDQERF